jgi:hypothetical protein
VKRRFPILPLESNLHRYTKGPRTLCNACGVRYMLGRPLKL